MTSRFSLYICATASRCDLPPSMSDASCAMPEAITVLTMAIGKEQFWEEPTARNSKRFPQKGKG
eukprot:CAMPEP_0169370930 /NCGR_PEP_ID=MMETSP1017-20121227/35617_1 /TAXON_ID=342587 /ORGANISM="Karlodinium micrum, Strain CCMP2283" /LENGTH=63 /DNA_ID=CAMNT_0009469375 /DNA_START=138 /DNA_END=325 /DNA_ORIENTATION=+